jgi:protein NirF
MMRLVLAALALFAPLCVQAAEPRGTGALGLVIERATGSVQIVDFTERRMIGRVEGLGDLSHASVVFSPDQRFGFVFGRDGGLTKVDLLEQRVARRIVQGGNAIGGAISDDGALIAVSNYEPGGVKVFDARTLDQVAEIPAIGANGKASKTVGLVDLPGRRFIYTLYDAGEIWLADFSRGEAPLVTRLSGIGALPYDGNVTADGRHYFAGLFGEDGIVHLDLWADVLKPERVLSGYGRGEQPLPVYKMPHLEGWGAAQDKLYLPAIGRHELLAIGLDDLKEKARILVHGQPVFAVMRPDGRHVWVNFAHPRNDTIDVVDTLTQSVVRRFVPGPAVLHMEFTPRGNEVWVSVRDADRVDIYDARSFEKVGEVASAKPSGIFFTARAGRIGQ